jgi:hypothetical protein
MKTESFHVRGNNTAQQLEHIETSANTMPKQAEHFKEGRTIPNTSKHGNHTQHTHTMRKMPNKPEHHNTRPSKFKHAPAISNPDQQART